MFFFQQSVTYFTYSAPTNEQNMYGRIKLVVQSFSSCSSDISEVQWNFSEL